MLDPVDEWKRVVRRRTDEEANARAGRPTLELSISPGFVALVGIIGALGGVRGAFWTPVLVVTALIAHELPRALCAARLGRSSRIALSPFGSEVETRGEPLRGPPGAAFAVVGSLVNFALALAALALLRNGAASSVGPLLEGAALCHAAWAVAQALPLAPFRGHALIAGSSPQLRLAVAVLTAVSIVGLGVLAAYWRHDPAPLALLALALTAALRAARDAYLSWRDDLLGVERTARDAEARLAAGDATASAELAHRALIVARSSGLRTRLSRIYAWAGVGKNDPVTAHFGLMGLPAEHVDLHLLAAYLASCNRVDEALEVLLRAREAGQRAPETTKLLVDLLFRRGDERRALAVARADAALLSADDQVAVERATSTSGPRASAPRPEHRAGNSVATRAH